jgi:hypothetical protein
MALVANFLRFAYDHGDLNTWQPLYLRLIKAGGIGGLSCELSNNAGALQLGLGFGGIDNGTLAGFGAIEVTTAGDISLAGVTNGVWHAVEYSVSGTAVTFYVTALAGETDESFMSLTMKGYYDGSKQGYYRIASRRVLGFVFLRAALALGRIVNCESGKLGFKGIEIVDYIVAGVITKKYLAKMRINIGSWDMDGTLAIALSYPFNIINFAEIVNCIVTIISDSAAQIFQLNYKGEGSFSFENVGYVTLSRTTGGWFDSATFNDPAAQRGYVIIQWYT